MSNDYEKVIARIQIVDENDNSLVFAYNREVLNQLGLKKRYDGEFLQIGTHIEFQGIKYEILNVVFKLYPDLYQPILGGVSETPELTEMSEYDSEVNVFVRRVD